MYSEVKVNTGTDSIHPSSPARTAFICNKKNIPSLMFQVSALLHVSVLVKALKLLAELSYNNRQ